VSFSVAGKMGERKGKKKNTGAMVTPKVEEDAGPAHRYIYYIEQAKETDGGQSELWNRRRKRFVSRFF
jgi:hypothetical protein